MEQAETTQFLINDPETLAIFTEEYREAAAKIRSQAIVWQADTQNQQVLEEIRRAYHTLKGSGRMMGAMALGDYAWAYENLLNHVLSGQLTISKNLTHLIDISGQSLQKQQIDFLEKNQLDDTLQQQLDQAEDYLNPQKAIESIDPIEVITPKTESITSEPQPESDQKDRDKHSKVVNKANHAENNTIDPSIAKDSDISSKILAAQTRTTQYDKEKFQRDKEEKTNQVILSLFKNDLPELLEEIDSNMLAIQQQPEEQKNCIVLERALHTLKGGARMVNAQSLADIAHDAESLLHDIVTGIQPMDHPTIKQVQAAIDHIQNLAETVLLDDIIQAKSSKKLEAPIQSFLSFEEPANGSNTSYHSLLEQLLAEQKDNLHLIKQNAEEADKNTPDSQADVNTASSSKKTEMIRLPASVIDNMVSISTEININQTRLSEHLQHFGSDIAELLTTATRLGQQLRALELETEAQIRHSYHAEQQQINAAYIEDDDQFDPLEMDQYSEIQQLSRFIQEGLNDLSSIEENLSAEQARIQQVVKTQSKMSQKMQQHLLATRLVAVSTLSPRLERIARQTSESLAKQVKFEIQGEQCELDRVVLQKITAPLEHMIRNAVSHGIETPPQRLANNKKECGRVVLKIQRDGAEIVLRLSDDGQGINQAAVYEKALAMDIISPDDKLSDEAIQRLIFHSGLSTSSELSQISGRGVGMDIVKREIKSMGGNLQLVSSAKGTEFVIHLPLTLATNHVLLFEVAQQRYAIPMTGVVGLQRISYRELQKNFAKKKPKQLYNQYHYKLQHLAQVLQQPIIFEGQPEDKCPVLFVHMDGQRIAYRLDKISGNRDVVIKPLGRILHASSLYTAATIESDGYVIPILNTLELVHRKPKKIQLTQAYQQQLKRIQTHKAMIMIVDDSITIRKITKALLRSHDYDVITAKDGMHALEVLSTQTPDIMLLDIEMPRMDGFELLSNLRNTKTWQNLPVIMISSRTAEKHRRYAEAVGVNKFMGKPYQESELLASIQQLLEQTSSPITPEVS